MSEKYHRPRRYDTRYSAACYPEEMDQEESGTDHKSARSLTVRNVGIGFHVLALIAILTAMTTNYWLARDSDLIQGNTYEKYGRPDTVWTVNYNRGSLSFDRLGLWMHCTGLPHLSDIRFDSAYDSCQGISTLFSSQFQPVGVGGKSISGLPAFLTFVQITYALGSTFLLTAGILILVHGCLGCCRPHRKPSVLIFKLIGHFTLVSVVLILLVVVVFGVKANGENLIELQSRYNHLSWSFYTAILGIVLELVSAVFFEIEAYNMH